MYVKYTRYLCLCCHIMKWLELSKMLRLLITKFNSIGYHVNEMVTLNDWQMHARFLSWFDRSHVFFYFVSKGEFRYVVFYGAMRRYLILLYTVYVAIRLLMYCLVPPVFIFSSPPTLFS